MDEFLIQGRLRIRADNYEREIAYIRTRVGTLSNARLTSTPGYEFLKFWHVDFAATPAQWSELAPELDRRNVLVTLFESPALMGGEQESGAEQSDETVPPAPRSPYRWVPWAVFAVAPIAVALAFLVPNWAMVFVCIGGLAFVAALFAGVFVALQEA